ncbi:MAG: hypothetical protein J6I45_03735 [Clostridia bacterium]|nr:hypothetical protein [Clostridia bacterium]
MARKYTKMEILAEEAFRRKEAAGYKFVKRKMEDFFLSPCIKIQIFLCRSRGKQACFARP